MLKSISFIIPCYNMEKYVERCYKSLSIQIDAEDVEFIFVDDGSKDLTLNILKKLKAVDERVIVIHQENAGVSVARNKALEVVNGEYVYILDSDDYLSTDDVVSTIKLLIRTYNPDIIMPSYNIDSNGNITCRVIPLSEGLYSKYDLFNRFNVFPTDSKLLYRTAIIRDNRLIFDPKIRCGEVYTFTINYLRYIEDKTIYVLDKPFQNYFIRDDSAVRKPNYLNDITVIDAIGSIYYNADELIHYPSFRLTAFLLFTSFTYRKYLKFSINKEMLDYLNVVMCSESIKRCISDVAFENHKSLLNRILALYFMIMPKVFGFKVLHKIKRFR